MRAGAFRARDGGTDRLGAVEASFEILTRNFKSDDYFAYGPGPGFSSPLI